MAETDPAHTHPVNTDLAKTDLPKPHLADPASTPITRDAFLGGRLVLEQTATGHRSGTDAVLLAAAVRRDFSGLVYDMGAGVGAVGLAIALACPTSAVLLVEKDASTSALAKTNIEANGFAARVEIVQCDLLLRPQREAKLTRKADLIVTNPPFHRADRVRLSHDAGRRAAHVLDEGASLEDWLASCLASLAPKGSLIVLHQAEAVPEILNILSGRLGELTMMAVHPRESAPAARVLVRGKHGSRAPFRMASPLVLHEGETFTRAAAAIHEGRAALDW